MPAISMISVPYATYTKMVIKRQKDSPRIHSLAIMIMRFGMKSKVAMSISVTATHSRRKIEILSILRAWYLRDPNSTNPLPPIPNTMTNNVQKEMIIFTAGVRPIKVSMSVTFAMLAESTNFILSPIQSSSTEYEAMLKENKY